VKREDSKRTPYAYPRTNYDSPHDHMDDNAWVKMRMIAHNSFFKTRKEIEIRIKDELRMRGRPAEPDTRDLKTFRDFHSLKSGIKTFAEKSYGKPQQAKTRYCLHLKRKGQSGKSISIDREDKSEKTLKRREIFLESLGKLELIMRILILTQRILRADIRCSVGEQRRSMEWQWFGQESRSLGFPCSHLPIVSYELESVENRPQSWTHHTRVVRLVLRSTA